MARLNVENVSKRFGAGGPAAVENFTMDVQDAEFIALLGPSGCGKSTVLNMIAGLERTTAGTIRVADRQVRGPGRDRGVVFQNYSLMPWLTALDNVAFALLDELTDARVRKTRATEALALVGLEHAADRLPHELSGGMRQRVAIARSLCYSPKILLMDEPFGALDAMTRHQMQSLLLGVWERHRITVVFVTHDVDEAIFLADRIILMSARPGRMDLDIPVHLPRPRDDEVLTSPYFQDIKRQLLKRIGGYPH